MSVTAASCAGLVSRVLRTEFGEVRAVGKRMARRHGWSQRAFENWFFGTNAPRMAELVVLMAECPALEEEVLALVRAKRGCA
jgi:hypothetical protein